MTICKYCKREKKNHQSVYFKKQHNNKNNNKEKDIKASQNTLFVLILPKTTEKRTRLFTILTEKLYGDAPPHSTPEQRDQSTVLYLWPIFKQWQIYSKTTERERLLISYNQTQWYKHKQTNIHKCVYTKWHLLMYSQGPTCSSAHTHKHHKSFFTLHKKRLIFFPRPFSEGEERRREETRGKEMREGMKTGGSKEWIGHRKIIFFTSRKTPLHVR